MIAKDIKPRVWYATKEKYSYPDAVILDGIEKYTVEGRTVFGGIDERVIFASPDRPLNSGGRRYWENETGYLAVKLYGDAKMTVQRWVLHGENEQAAHAVMTEAAALLTKVVEAVAERGRVPWTEFDQEENRARGIGFMIIQGRDIVDEYAKLVKLKYENEQASIRSCEAAEAKTEQRRQRMVDILAKARALGLNTDPSKGGAQDSYSSWNKYTKVEMSVDTYVELVAEIERLRSVVAATLRADEGGTRAGA
jgi:hypothetical protein